jgi:hypothetical protein
MVAIMLAGLAGMGAAIGALGLVMVLAVRRLFFVRLITQDGTMCPSCGYCVAYLENSRCPECGSSFDRAQLCEQGRSTVRPAAAGKRRILMSAAIVSAVAVVVVGGWIWRSGQYAPYFLVYEPWYWEYVSDEGPAERGDAFSAVLGALESRARGGTYITPETMRAIVGPPDLYQTVNGDVYYIYFFGDDKRSVAYVDFIKGRLTVVGYNVVGVNDHSRYKPYPAP